MLLSFSCFSFFVTSLSLSIDGNDVLNRSPLISTKSTFSFMHVSTVFVNAFVLRSASFGSLQLPIWQSAMCANFILSLTPFDWFVCLL